MGNSDDLPPLRAVIAKYQLSAQKSLGQNFLLDLNLTSKIARQAGNLSEFDVLEIGPGPGGLTRALLAEGARRVVAVEKDQRCIPALEQIAKIYPKRLKVLEADALSIDPLEYLNTPIKIVANLPYNIGTELLVRWLTPQRWPPFWASLTLMFQTEVAKRIVAPVGSKSYGRLAVLAQWRSVPTIAMHLPASVFTPRPKVSSAVIHISALTSPHYDADPQALELTVAKAFNQRRKMLRSSLKGITPNLEYKLLKAGIPPTKRAEQITIKQFCLLAREI
ncbi:MAG: 16S rRNA (adenine(1518)-N(6)/adenine(1519)-N(6))-dimethyltransferase [Rhodobacteraceae bacterium]|nr:16S rRNA (adenine(1518)-N(6)/adenine(1519)-N(6))-dimethyltransferase [Paracoccaceae bacterium]